MKSITTLSLLFLCVTAQAELRLPAIISDHMVLQQQQSNAIWGWDTAGTEVKVSFAGKTVSGKAGQDGKWRVKLPTGAANAQPQVLTVEGSSKRSIQDVLVGEVWLCSGQSNMGFAVGNATDSDLVLLGAADPLLRLVSVPNVGTQVIQDDFQGAWAASDGTTAKDFTAVGYFYGKKLREVLGVPVGLIDNAWGGSAAEAWVRRDVLEKDAKFTVLLDKWRATEKSYSKEAFDKKLADWNAKAKEWYTAASRAKRAGQPEPKGRPGRAPRDPMVGQQRPGNLYAGCLHPIIGYGIKGAIWYQGESNSGDPELYSYLFPLMINHWRSEWQQGDFPFYWVQLADYKAETAEPQAISWAQVREAQTQTMKLPHTGQAVIIDVGEGKDIHPRNKRDVAERLVRWPLATLYGKQMPYRSAELKKAEFQGSKAILTLDTFGAGAVETFDVREVLGLQACGEDQVWHWAQGKVIGPDQIEVTCAKVAKPVAVRYAWSDNPVCNLYTAGHNLPVTPFRTDSFPTAAPTARR